jgi:RNA polymerase sigma factor (sigma-70 family)
MASAQLPGIMSYLRRLADPHAAGGVPDAELLERFLVGRDEAAFELLVRRHGPLVMGVCRRVLQSAHDAEDAFQATFLKLVHRAGSIRKQTSISSWLYAVAYRTALRMRMREAKRPSREREAGLRIAREDEPGRWYDNAAVILDEEVNRLPEKYRAPVVLCYLRGVSYDDAARHLGCPRGTLAVRLVRARERLRVRLVRRGVGTLGLLLSSTLAEHASAAVPASIIRSTICSATLAAEKLTTFGLIAARLAVLGQTLWEVFTMSRWHRALGGLMALGVVSLGPCLLAGQALFAPTTEARPQDKATLSAAPHRDATKPADEPARLAREAWLVTDAVLHKHLQPTSRADMLKAGVAGLYKAVERPLPPDVARQAAEAQSSEQLATLLRAVWPANATASSTASLKLEGALFETMLAGVPGKPSVIPELQLRVREQVANNRYVGLGIQIRMNEKENLPELVGMFRNGAAYEGGMRINDLFVEVDGQSMQGVSIRKAVETLRGADGSQVTLLVRQPGKEPRTLHLMRRIHPVETVVGYRRNGDEWTYRIDPALPIAYAGVTTIKASTLHELRQLETRLRAEGDRALILDFRTSQGDDVMQYATLVADAFLDGGVMWTIRDAQGNRQECRADRECLFRGWPVIALIGPVDGDLAAQGAILAALQDNGRAQLVGETFPADGFIKTLVTLPDDAGAVACPTSRIERAAGHGWPVQPDVKVGMTGEQRVALGRWFQQQELVKGSGPALRPEDPPLKRAVELLRQGLDSRPAERTAEKGR